MARGAPKHTVPLKDVFTRHAYNVLRDRTVPPAWEYGAPVLVRLFRREFKECDLRTRGVLDLLETRIEDALDDLSAQFVYLTPFFSGVPYGSEDIRAVMFPVVFGPREVIGPINVTLTAPETAPTPGADSTSPPLDWPQRQAPLQGPTKRPS